MSQGGNTAAHSTRLCAAGIWRGVLLSIKKLNPTINFNFIYKFTCGPAILVLKHNTMSRRLKTQSSLPFLNAFGGIWRGVLFTPLFHFSHCRYIRHVHQYTSSLCSLIKSKIDAKSRLPNLSSSCRYIRHVHQYASSLYALI